MRNITGREAAFDPYIVKVFAERPRVSQIDGSNISTRVRQSFAPGIVKIKSQPAREPLLQRRLPRVVIRLLGIIEVRSLDVVGIRSIPGQTIDGIEGPPEIELHTARSNVSGFQYQR